MPHRWQSRSRDRRDQRRSSTRTYRAHRSYLSPSPRRPHSRREYGHHDRQASSHRRFSQSSDRGRSDRYDARRTRDERDYSRSRTRKSQARSRSDRDRSRSRSERRYHSPAHRRHERNSSSERHQSLAYSRHNDRRNSRGRHNHSRRRSRERRDSDDSRSYSRSRTAGSTRYEQRQSPERHSPPRHIHDRGAIRNAPQRQNVHLEDSRTDGDADVPRQTGRTPAAPTLSQIAAAPRTQAILNNGIYDFESRRPNGDGRQSFNPALWRTTGGLDSHHSYEGSMAAGVVASHAPTSTSVRPGQQTEPDVYMRIAAEDAETERANNELMEKQERNRVLKARCARHDAEYLRGIETLARNS